jgi:hypothetical protein
MALVETTLRRPDFFVKWAASVLQVLGYTLTAFDITPWNLYMFFGGLAGWFLVGVLWNDRAIMLIHVIAFAAMLTGMLSS